MSLSKRLLINYINMEMKMQTVDENKLEQALPRLEFCFSVDTEIDRIKYTLKKLEWYIDKGYGPLLPKTLNISKDKSLSDDEIRKAVTEEFDISIYQNKQKEIEKVWSEFNSELFTKLTTLNLPLQNTYKISLTSYGVGGSYNHPSTVQINFLKCGDFKFILTHEIIHLTIEHLIKQYEIDHWTKERLVNLTQNKFFAEQAQLQTGPDNPEKVSEIFNRYFPDIKKIIIELSNK